MLRDQNPIEIGPETMDYLQEFSPAMLKVYLTLLFYAPHESRELVITMTQLANLCSLSIISVKKALGKLNEKKFIEDETLLPSERKIRIRLLKDFFSEKKSVSEKSEIKSELLKEEEQPSDLPYVNANNANVNNADINIYANSVNANVNGGSQNQNYSQKHTEFVPKSKEEVFALEIAKTFVDMKHLPLYISLCQKYPENVILKAYGQAKETKDVKIKKSRGALFTYLVNKYGKEYPQS